MKRSEEYKYINSRDLSNYSKDFSSYNISKTASEAVSKVMGYEKTAGFDINVFVSHSHYDANFVKLTVGLLNRHGAKPYIDWLDPTMPAVTDNKTAKKLRIKIDFCDKFVMLASKKAPN